MNDSIENCKKKHYKKYIFINLIEMKNASLLLETFSINFAKSTHEVLENESVFLSKSKSPFGRYWCTCCENRHSTAAYQCHKIPIGRCNFHLYRSMFAFPNQFRMRQMKSDSQCILFCINRNL